MWTVHCAMVTVHSAMVNVQCALCTVHCALCTVHCALCTVHCALFTVHCSLCTVYCSLYSMQSVRHTTYKLMLSAVWATERNFRTLNCAGQTFSAVRYGQLKYTAIRAVHYSIVECRWLQYSTVHYSTVQCTGGHYTTVHYSLQKCSIALHYNTVLYPVAGALSPEIVAWPPPGRLGEVHNWDVHRGQCSLASV